MKRLVIAAWLLPVPGLAAAGRKTDRPARLALDSTLPLGDLGTISYADAQGQEIDLGEKLSQFLGGLGPLDAEETRLLGNAARVSLIAHKDDYRNFNVAPMPYIRHVIGAVKTLVEEFGIRDARSVSVMLLHDVKEDHPDVWENERHHFDERVQHGVALLDKGADANASLDRLMENGTREIILAKLSDRSNNLRGVRFNLEEHLESPRRVEVLNFARQQFAKTEEHLLPRLQSSPKLQDADRRIFYGVVLAQIRRIQGLTSEASFLDGFKEKLSALLATDEPRTKFDHPDRVAAAIAKLGVFFRKESMYGSGNSEASPAEATYSLYRLQAGLLRPPRWDRVEIQTSFWHDRRNGNVPHELQQEVLVLQGGPAPSLSITDATAMPQGLIPAARVDVSETHVALRFVRAGRLFVYTFRQLKNGPLQWTRAAPGQTTFMTFPASDRTP